MRPQLDHVNWIAVELPENVQSGDLWNGAPIIGYTHLATESVFTNVADLQAQFDFDISNEIRKTVF